MKGKRQTLKNATLKSCPFWSKCEDGDGIQRGKDWKKSFNHDEQNNLLTNSMIIQHLSY